MSSMLNCRLPSFATWFPPLEKPSGSRRTGGAARTTPNIAPVLKAEISRLAKELRVGVKTLTKASPRRSRFASLWGKIVAKLSRSGLIGERLFMTVACRQRHALCVTQSLSPRTDFRAPFEGVRLSPPPLLVDFNPRDLGPGDFFVRDGPTMLTKHRFAAYVSSPPTRHALRMRKPRQTDLDITPPPPAAKKRITKSRKSPASRRRLLLLDYESWVAMTNDVAEAAARVSKSA
ncbi:MAG: hypothetical protein EOP82_10380 [Variovorax sp.]|nr:MAG: hypothetical protein EOP82_10380 [Variovorax sp.]